MLEYPTINPINSFNMRAAGLLFGYIELIFWTFFACYVLKDPYAIRFFPIEVKRSLYECSDFFHIFAITMIVTGFLWLYGVYKVGQNQHTNNAITFCGQFWLH